MRSVLREVAIWGGLFVITAPICLLVALGLYVAGELFLGDWIV